MDIKKMQETVSQKAKAAIETIKIFIMPKKSAVPLNDVAEKPKEPWVKAVISRIKNFKWTRKNIIIIAVVLIVLAIFVKMTSNIQHVLFKKKPSVATPAVTFEEEAVPVKIYKIKRMDFKDTLPAMGNIKGFKEIDLKFQVPGILESFNFEEGEKVQEGDIIASLIQKEALLKLKYAEIDMNKNQKLFELGAINQMKFDQSKLEYESAKTELDKTNIYATSNGLLGTKLIDVGAYVTPNDKIGSFVQNDKVYAEFNIIEKDVPKVSLGQKAEVFVDAYPNKSFQGSIDRLAPVIEGRSRTENIKVEIENRDGLLKPGMFVRALIATYEKKEALVVPSSALKKKEADYFVYVVHREEPKEETTEDRTKERKKGFFGLFNTKSKKKPDAKPELAEKPAEFGAVEIRKIKLGYMTQDLVEIDEGLKDDEMVIVEVSEEFKDKARVEISEVQEGIF